MVTGENSFLVEDVMKIILIIDRDITLSVRTEKKAVHLFTFNLYIVFTCPIDQMIKVH